MIYKKVQVTSHLQASQDGQVGQDGKGDGPVNNGRIVLIPDLSETLSKVSSNLFAKCRDTWMWKSPSPGISELSGNELWSAWKSALNHMEIRSEPHGNTLWVKVGNQFTFSMNKLSMEITKFLSLCSTLNYSLVNMCFLILLLQILVATSFWWSSKIDNWDIDIFNESNFCETL